MNLFTAIGNLILEILKLPNRLWPSWAKGARMTFTTVLLAITTAATKIEIPLVSELICWAWNLALHGCVPAFVTSLIQGFLVWAGLALTIEDQQQKTAADIPTIFNNIPKQKAA